jgi:hypothetical protein
MSEELFKDLKFDKQLKKILEWFDDLTIKGLKIAKADILRKIEEIENEYKR